VSGQKGDHQASAGLFFTVLFKQLLGFYPDRHPEILDQEALMKFLLHGVQVKKWGEFTQNQAVNAVKFYYEKAGACPYTTVHTLRHSFATHLWELRPRRARSRERICAIFKA